MSYLNTTDQAQEFADQALKHIQSNGLTPTPENFELWFVYASDGNTALKEAVNAILKRDDAMSDDVCYELFQEFLSSSREEKTVKQAGDQIQKTIKDVNSAVTSAKERAAIYGDSLKEMNTKLESGAAPEDLGNAVSDVMSNTKDMMSYNAHLEEMLEHSSNAIEDMQRDLDIARKEALTDALTSLSNRKAFDQEIRRLQDLANEEEEYVFSLILLDIDHFKKFNDTFGHQVGDQVLKLVARTLKDGLKGRDIAARYGGEEFAILLPETSIIGAEKVADILRQEVEKKEVVNRLSGKSIAKITMSAGVSQYSPSEETSVFIERVDSALYKAKDQGRNCVVTAQIQNMKMCS